MSDLYKAKEALKHRRRITITVVGKTEEALEDAFNEASRLVREGNWSGANSNDAGGFFFDSTDQVADDEVPA